MRLRVIAIIAGVLLLIGGGIWLFSKGSNSGTMGAGGIPLIKADANPAKLPPDDPGGEIMPNADSTVFTAMGAGADADPSMKNVKAPEPEAPIATEDTSFAGLRTGFAIPKEPEKKTESLFDEPESKYFSGGALKPVDAEHAEETKTEDHVTEAPAVEHVAEPVVEAIKKEPNVEDVAAVEETLAPVKIEEAAPIETTEEAPKAVPLFAEGANAAQNMEAEEMGFVRPVSKPPVPEQKAQQAREPIVLGDKPKAEDKPAPVAKPKETADSKPEKASGKYYIQLASSPGKGDASGVWNRLQDKYPAALDGLKPVYLPVTVAGKGDYVRIQAGPLSETQARERCTKLRSVDPAGGCLVLRR